jgi:hypothetical protein
VAGFLTTLWSWQGLQFIGINGGGREFQGGRVAVGGGRRALAQWLGVLRRGNCFGDQRRARAGYGDAVERVRHATDNGDGLTAVRILIRGRWVRGEVPRLAGVTSSSLTAMIHHPATLSINSRHESSHWWYESRRRISHWRWGLPALAVWSYQALYHRELPSEHLTANVWAKFSLKFPWQHVQISAAKLCSYIPATILS